MGQLAFLAPVGPFAGLSNAARQKISDSFPTLSISEIESAVATFLLDLQATRVEPRLSQARNELNIFAKELERFHSALNQIRKYRLDHAIGAASRMIGGENQFEELEHSLDNLRTAIRQTSRVLPPGRHQLASRRLVTTLARQVKQAGLKVGRGSDHCLLALMDLIFEDLMVGGDAARVVREWHQSQTADIDHERASLLLDLVP